MSISVTQEELVLSVPRDLGNGQVEEATGHFADEFRLKDHGIGLEFKDKQRLGGILRGDTGTLPRVRASDRHDLAHW